MLGASTFAGNVCPVLMTQLSMLDSVLTASYYPPRLLLLIYQCIYSCHSHPCNNASAQAPICRVESKQSTRQRILLQHFHYNRTDPCACVARTMQFLSIRHRQQAYLRMMSFAVMGTAVPPPPHELHAIIPRPLQVAHPTSESDHLLHMHGTIPATNKRL